MTHAQLHKIKQEIHAIESQAHGVDCLQKRKCSGAKWSAQELASLLFYVLNFGSKDFKGLQLEDPKTLNPKRSELEIQAKWRQIKHLRLRQAQHTQSSSIEEWLVKSLASLLKAKSTGEPEPIKAEEKAPPLDTELAQND